MSAVLHFAWLWEVSWLIGWRCLVYVCKRTVHGRVLMCDFFFHIPVAFLFACSDLYLCGLYMIVPVLCWILCFWGIFDTNDIVWVGCDLCDCPFIHKFVFILRYCHKSCKEWPLALSCLSIRPQGTSCVSLDDFSWNYIFGIFSKIHQEDLSLVKSGPKHYVYDLSPWVLFITYILCSLWGMCWYPTEPDKLLPGPG